MAAAVDEIKKPAPAENLLELFEVIEGVTPAVVESETPGLSLNDTSTDQAIVDESPALIEESLEHLKAAIKSSGDDKAEWAPHPKLEKGLGSRLTFLRWAKFDVEKARLRRAVYWEERFALWPDGIITCAGDSVLQDALSLGVAEVPLGARDNFGRQVCCVSLPRTDLAHGMNPRDILRVFWYMQHAAYEPGTQDPEGLTSRRGIVVLSTMEGLGLGVVKKETAKMIIRSLQEVLPVRVGAMRLLHQPWFFNVIWSCVAVFMSPKMRKRVVLHGANEASLLQHMPKESIPTAVGGSLSWDHQAWVKDRIAKDEAMWIKDRVAQNKALAIFAPTGALEFCG